MARILQYALLIRSLSICHNAFEAKTVVPGLYISFIACDSTGSERIKFSTEDPLYFKCCIVNNTAEDVSYELMEYHPRNREPWLQDIFFVECRPNDESRPVVIEDSPPPGTIRITQTLIPGDSLTQVRRYYTPHRILKAGEYKAWLYLHYSFSKQLISYPVDNHSYLNFGVLDKITIDNLLNDQII